MFHSFGRKVYATDFFLIQHSSSTFENFQASSSRTLSSERSESSSSSRDDSSSSNFEESVNEDEEDERQKVTAEEPTINETAVEPHESTLKDASGIKNYLCEAMLLQNKTFLQFQWMTLSFRTKMCLKKRRTCSRAM